MHMMRRGKRGVSLGAGALLGLGAVFSSYATSVEMDDAKEQMSALE